MTETPLTPQTPLQRLIVQRALLLATQLEAAAQQAPRGTTLHACETLLLDRGRQFLRDSLADTLHDQLQAAEKKGAPRAPVPADTPAATRASATVSS